MPWMTGGARQDLPCACCPEREPKPPTRLCDVCLDDESAAQYVVTVAGVGGTCAALNGTWVLPGSGTSPGSGCFWELQWMDDTTTHSVEFFIQRQGGGLQDEMELEVRLTTTVPPFGGDSARYRLLLPDLVNEIDCLALVNLTIPQLSAGATCTWPATVLLNGPAV